jgi:hypothetical protein
MPKLIVRFLLYWYQTQQFALKWCNFISETFTVSNGVRQGGILSPRMFNVFIDDLSTVLNNSGVGCHLNDVCYNHLIYADDCVLLAPSPRSLQKLLDICNNYAKTYDMVYNVKKTVCMCINSYSKTSPFIPDVFLDDVRLKWLSEYKYLGVFITKDLSDDADMKRQMKCIYSKGNTLVRKFTSCSLEVKVQLFKSFCTSMYCSALWNKYNVNSYKQLQVSYNNVFRYLLSVKGPCSISRLFLDHNVDNFKVICRKAVHSLLLRLNMCDNNLTKTLFNSMYFTYSSHLYKDWKNMLYTYQSI